MEKTITIISSVNFTLFKGLSQEDLTSKNPSQPDRLNIRPLWAQRVDAERKIQRFDFKVGENECPDYILKWDSFKQMADNGTLAVKGSYTQATAQADTKSLEEIKRLQEELAEAKAQAEKNRLDKEKAEAELKKQKVKTIEA